jgi:uncharacterized protein (DUF427 family)
MDDHYLQLERTKGRVTARLGDEVLARSERTILMREFVHGQTLDPVYYFPPQDVAVDKLRPTETRTHCPIKGDASYWTYSGSAGAEEDLVWGYLEPIASSRHLAGRMAFDARRVSFEVEPLDA